MEVGDVCAVPGCTNQSGKADNVVRDHVKKLIWYTCPKDQWLPIWERLINCQPPSPVTRHTKVCSNHFLLGRPKGHHPHPCLYMTGYPPDENIALSVKDEQELEGILASQLQHTVSAVCGRKSRIYTNFAKSIQEAQRQSRGSDPQPSLKRPRLAPAPSTAGQSIANLVAAHDHCYSGPLGIGSIIPRGPTLQSSCTKCNESQQRLELLQLLPCTKCSELKRRVKLLQLPCTKCDEVKGQLQDKVDALLEFLQECIKRPDLLAKDNEANEWNVDILQLKSSKATSI